MSQFPSPPRDDENMSFSSSNSQQYINKKSLSKRILPQPNKISKEDDDEESNYDDDDNSEEQDKQPNQKGRNKFKKNVLSIQQKVIQKKLTNRNQDNNKIRKLNIQHSGPIQTFLYKPSQYIKFFFTVFFYNLMKIDVFLPCLSPYLNSLIEIRISREYIQKKNPALINRLVWGANGSYSSHSDAVAIAIHHGMLSLSDIKLQSQIYEGVSLYFKVVKGKKILTGSFKSGILSRTLKQQCPHCLRPEKTQWLDQLGTPEQLVQWARKMAIPQNKRLTKQTQLQVSSYDYAAPNQRTIQEIMLNKMIPPLNEGWIVWNMCNEPSQKYNIITFMDRTTQAGYKSNTSYKLRNHDLFIETRQNKYEIYMEQMMREDDVFLEQSIYSIAEVIEPKKVDLEYMQAVGLPLPSQHKKELFNNLRWDQFIWGQNYLKIKDKNFIIEELQCFVLIPLQLYQRNQ